MSASTAQRTPNTDARRLTVPLEGDLLVPLPGPALGRARLVVVVPLASEAAVFAARAGETAEFPVLVYGSADPVDSGVVPDHLVHGVNHDDFEVLVHGIFVEPVRVQDAQGAAAPSGALLRHGAQVSREFQLLHTLVHGLTVADTTAHGPLAATAAHARAVDAKALLGLVP